MQPTRGTREARSRERLHRLLLAVLLVLLVGFSVWCVDVWRDRARLRTAVDARLGWVDDLQELEKSLETSGVDPSTPPSRIADEDLERIGSALSADPEAQVAVRRLAEAQSRFRDGDGDDPDAAWSARAAARQAAVELRTLLLRDLVSLLSRLEGHWRSIGWLLVCSLGLAASNLALLGLAHRRRRELARAHRREVELVSRDRLTGLWNREEILDHLRRELERIRRAPASLGLVLADLDDFRETSDFLGQDAGDRVLREVAARYLSRLRAYDQVGRFGSDSFLFVLPSCDLVATRAVADRIHGAMTRPFEHEHGRVELSATLVWTAAQGPKTLDLDNVVRRIQNELDRARREARGTVQENPGPI